jgi:hypothetical protein
VVFKVRQVQQELDVVDSLVLLELPRQLERVHPEELVNLVVASLLEVFQVVAAAAAVNLAAAAAAAVLLVQLVVLVMTKALAAAAAADRLLQVVF